MESQRSIEGLRQEWTGKKGPKIELLPTIDGLILQRGRDEISSCEEKIWRFPKWDRYLE